MTTQLLQIKWGRILGAAILVYLLSFLIIFGVIFGYAFFLGFQARGTPDSVQIQRFANQVAPWGGRLGLVLLTGVAAAWMARRVETGVQVQGFILGLVIGLPNLIIGRLLSLEGMATVILTLGAGWLGNVLGGKRG